MTRVGRLRTLAGARGWPAAKAGRVELAYISAVDALAVVVFAAALAAGIGPWAGWGRTLLLAILAIGFEEGSRRAARLQIRLRAPLRADMTSVWAVAGAVALSRVQAALLVFVVLIYIWFRHQRPAHEPMYRKFFVISTALLGVLAADTVAGFVGGVSGSSGWHLAGLTAVVLAMATYTVTNRVLVTVLLVIIGARGKDLIGSVHDNMIELATLCLGGLVALAVVFEPWLTVLVLAPMITLQRGALVRDLEVAATTDAKTGLLNAVAWEQVAQREIARSLREARGLAVLIVDIDHFKTVNDCYGHLVGDVVLRSLSERLATSLREYDTLGRFGGEEFVAVLPDVSVEAAMEIAERVRAQVNARTVADLAQQVRPEADIRLAVSIGVACLTMHGIELGDLLRSADHALYEAKEAGRNRVRLAGRAAGPDVGDRALTAG